MTSKTINIKETTQTQSAVRYRTPDGLVFTSREDYLDYVKGLRD